MHKNPKTLTTFFSSGTKLLLPSWLLGFHEEREIQFLLCWLFHLTQQRTGISCSITRLASSRSKSQLASSSLKFQLTAFFQKSPKILSPSLLGMMSITSPVHILSMVFIMISMIVTSALREREHLRLICAPTRALSRIVISLTKPKDKLSPTKNDSIKKILLQLYNMPKPPRSACWRPPASIVYFHLLTTLFGSFVLLKDSSARHIFISIYLLKHFICLRWSVPPLGPKHSDLFFVWC